MDHLTLMRLHIEALFTHDSHGQMLRVNEPTGARAPRFFLGRTTDGSVMRFREDVDETTRHALEEIVERASADAGRTAPIDPEPYEIILSHTAPILRTESGPAFSFAPTLSVSAGEVVTLTDSTAAFLEPHLRDWMPDVQLSHPLLALIIDSRAVAVCGSVRRTSSAHEAGVETAPNFRGRGYAPQVVAAWARAVREMDRVPLYSTSWKNEASRAVARKLGLIQFGSDLHVT